MSVLIMLINYHNNNNNKFYNNKISSKTLLIIIIILIAQLQITAKTHNNNNNHNKCQEFHNYKIKFNFNSLIVLNKFLLRNKFQISLLTFKINNNNNNNNHQYSIVTSIIFQNKINLISNVNLHNFYNKII